MGFLQLKNKLPCQPHAWLHNGEGIWLFREISSSETLQNYISAWYIMYLYDVGKMTTKRENDFCDRFYDLLYE